MWTLAWWLVRLRLHTFHVDLLLTWPRTGVIPPKWCWRAPGPAPAHQGRVQGAHAAQTQPDRPAGTWCPLARNSPTSQLRLCIPTRPQSPGLGHAHGHRRCCLLLSPPAPQAFSTVLRAGLICGRTSLGVQLYPGVLAAPLVLGTLGGTGGKFLCDVLLGSVGLRPGELAGRGETSKPTTRQYKAVRHRVATAGLQRRTRRSCADAPMVEPVAWHCPLLG